MAARDKAQSGVKTFALLRGKLVLREEVLAAELAASEANADAPVAKSTKSTKAVKAAEPVGDEEAELARMIAEEEAAKASEDAFKVEA